MAPGEISFTSDPQLGKAELGWATPSGPGVGMKVVGLDSNMLLLIGFDIGWILEYTKNIYIFFILDDFYLGQVDGSWISLMSWCQLIFRKFSKIYMFNVAHISLEFLI